MSLVVILPKFKLLRKPLAWKVCLKNPKPSMYTFVLSLNFFGTAWFFFLNKLHSLPTNSEFSSSKDIRWSHSTRKVTGNSFRRTCFSRNDLIFSFAFRNASWGSNKKFIHKTWANWLINILRSLKRHPLLVLGNETKK